MKNEFCMTRKIKKPMPPPKRMSNYRKRMRAAGLRPVQKSAA